MVLEIPGNYKKKLLFPGLEKFFKKYRLIKMFFFLKANVVQLKQIDYVNLIYRNVSNHRSCHEFKLVNIYPFSDFLEKHPGIKEILQLIETNLRAASGCTNNSVTDVPVQHVLKYISNQISWVQNINCLR